jgi:hypothetical protein
MVDNNSPAGARDIADRLIANLGSMRSRRAGHSRARVANKEVIIGFGHPASKRS